MTYELVSMGTRDDCDSCIWAYDLEIRGTLVTIDLGYCLDIVGVDAATASDWDGTMRSYGFDPDYIGHAEILMFFDGTVWIPASYASWDGSEVTYAWVDGLYDY